MSSWAQWTAKTIMLTAGFAAAGSGLSTVAFAQTAGNLPGPSGLVTSGNGSVGSGNQVSVPITIPVDVCGNAAAVLGIAIAGCQGGATATGAGGGAPAVTSGTGGVGSGNQVSVPVTAPVDVCGNAVGNAKANCVGGATASKHKGGGALVTSGNGSALSGNQVSVPVTAPVDVCGNSVAVLGLAGSACKGGAVAGGVSGAEHVVRCGCLNGADANTPLLTAYKTGAATPASAELTSYGVPAAGRPAAASQGSTTTQGAGAGKSVTDTVSRGTLPLVAGLPSLAGLSSLSGLASTPGGPMLLPQTALSSADGAGMSTTSFFTLAAGVLLAGISALKLSGRRARAVRGGKAAA